MSKAGLTKSQVRKLVVLGVFVILLVLASVLLYNFIVKPGPYYHKKPVTAINE